MGREDHPQDGGGATRHKSPPPLPATRPAPPSPSRDDGEDLLHVEPSYCPTPSQRSVPHGTHVGRTVLLSLHRQGSRCVTARARRRMLLCVCGVCSYRPKTADVMPHSFQLNLQGRYGFAMVLNSLKVVAFTIFAVALMLGLTFVFRAIPMIGESQILGLDLAFILGLLTAIPIAEAVFRRVFMASLW